jgi:hypothetical protein
MSSHQAPCSARSLLRRASSSDQLLGLEADYGDEPTVLSDPSGGPQPPFGTRCQLREPAIQRPADAIRIGDPALDDLDEHAAPFADNRYDAVSLSCVIGLVKRLN